MSSSFNIKLVNGSTGDPALFIDMTRLKKSLIFDLGSLTNLSAKDILKISNIFISHTHIDHFIGFDHLLRLHIGRPKKINIFGPPGITEQVESKLQGYTWNLLGKNETEFYIYEISDCNTIISHISGNCKFKKIDQKTIKSSNTILDDEYISVTWSKLDHIIPCYAYRLQEKESLNIDPVKLTELNINPGKWLNELKKSIKKDLPKSNIIETSNGPFKLGFLENKLVIKTKGKIISYVTDTILNENTSKNIIQIAQNADIFYCEAPFLDCDKDRADLTHHLTAAQTGILAQKAKVKRLKTFHYSPKYHGNYEILKKEAENHFMNLIN